MLHILEKQGWHLLTLVGLLSVVWHLARGDYFQGSYAGLPTRTWFWLSILIPVIHQIYVVVFWRAELHDQLLSSWFGKRSFAVWAAGFLVLLLSRPASILGLSIANQGTLFLPAWLGSVLTLVVLLPVGYLIYSVLRYFGIKRALGMDHFQPRTYQELPFVRQGIFRWSANAMYLFGFLLLYIPGLLYASRSGLLSAVFSHLYIWAHYYFTEVPDMRYIYQSK